MSRAAPMRRLGPLTWDQATRRYLTRSGRALTEAEVLAVLEREITSAKARFRALGERYNAGALSLPEFQIQLEGMTKRAILTGAAIERGGFAQLNQSDLGWIGQRVRTAFEAIRQLARDLESGAQRLDGRLLSRLDHYAQEHRAAQRAMQVRVARRDGFTHKRRVLGAADACRDSFTKAGRLLRHGCIEAARMGEVPIESSEVPEISTCTCLKNCRCHWVFTRRRAA